MQTLETMVQGTKVGPFLAFIYALIITIASGITLLIQANEAVKKHDQITQKVALAYGLSEVSAENLMCFHGILHYKNIGLYSGALAFTPNISCSKDELNKLQENPSRTVAFYASIFLLLGILMCWSAYFQLKQDNREKSS
ncbi:hypothetical protein QCB45_09695 [Thiomicrorhabdus sp. ZW0627]|uniref:hypothetical protein n=1 Tax=Thiomicrorhabdus sp. ZW0627 TaxID=3039774 RepID=UPI0024371DAF|nr:hypothetical protein [Thiomicrorhabdus sp. ZW0627]MDG6774606.1 hypothetical protein [Thiomicrorhabdus sp. ZW0627]